MNLSESCRYKGKVIDILGTGILNLPTLGAGEFSCIPLFWTARDDVTLKKKSEWVCNQSLRPATHPIPIIDGR